MMNDMQPFYFSHKIYRKKEGRWEAAQCFLKKGIYSTSELASRTIPHPPYTQEKKEREMVLQNCLNLILRY